MPDGRTRQFDLGFGIWDLGFGIWDLKFVLSPAFRRLLRRGATIEFSRGQSEASPERRNLSRTPSGAVATRLQTKSANPKSAIRNPKSPSPPLSALDREIHR